ncbi:Piso0_003197 [Millerozyma farinosa CBS 7064]|uniref:ubiquitinyl hydrolase 1 n=1 Tax=Pichia sorbitophila (strain ATCC MYA-4447 / BCRC 22081 / CBS 7064 / NBRC 10061 / NRRL Y-12695) TaxID=559304 RepID=G8YIF4_PICSO|nr:Piso0_003197 [Millerozyma farinosa CBS 7064]CCE80864.1 Piso0_003197 [Millerozyma farinosa CBS 7064]
MSQELPLSPVMPGGYVSETDKEYDAQSSEEDTSLSNCRKEIKESLAKMSRQEGETVFLILQDYLDKIMNMEAEGLEDLKDQIGPINCKLLMNRNISTTAIAAVSPQLFSRLSRWFGKVGEPQQRTLIRDPTSHELTIERFPPYFQIHVLSKGNARSFGHSHDSEVPGFFLSQTKTFNDLLHEIKSRVLKSSDNIDLRIWFISSGGNNTIPYSISLLCFLNEIPKKHLLLPKYYNSTLKNHGIVLPSYRVMAEIQDKSSHSYPIDDYFKTVDPDTFSAERITSSGGDLGLSNLGNTCYMNSALQCLLHIPEVNYYFFYNIFEKELNTVNPLGYKGQIAKAFGDLLHKLFDQSKNDSFSAVSPRDFKFKIGQYSSVFRGYSQQDSQEFLSWLLDALHEDLNRIIEKVYYEKPELKDEEVNDASAIKRLAETCWQQHKKRNDSVVVDLFTGMYQSTLVCPSCEKTSITFDPFNDLTLPLPVNKKWYHTFTIIDLSEEKLDNPIMKLEVELNKSSNYDDLIKYVSEFLKVSTDELFVYEMFNKFFYKDFQAEYHTFKYLPVSELISDTDEIIIYIIPHDPISDIVVTVLNTYVNGEEENQVINTFGLPLFLVLHKDDEAKSMGKIKEKLVHLAGILTRAIEYPGTEREIFYSAKDFPKLKKNDSSEDIEMADENDQNSNDEDEKGYDSDISLANPNISVDHHFTVKYHDDEKGYEHHRRNFSTDKSETAVHVPRTRFNYSTLPELSKKLPDLKYKYYHYPEIYTDGDHGLDVSPEKSESEDYVLVDKQKVDSKYNYQAPSVDASDEEIDSESDRNNPGPVGSLFDSVVTLPPDMNLNSDGISDRSSRHGSNEGVNGNMAEELTEGNIKRPVLVNNRTTLVCQWNFDSYCDYFQDEDLQTWKNVPFVPNPQIEANKKKLEMQQRSTVSLIDCLRSFSVPEVLGDQDLWYCPKCKDFKKATKTIQLWSIGDILAIHLKRFQGGSRSFSDKINMVVDFPIEGLDMSPFVASGQADNASAARSDLLYDLIAVDNHYGGLGGGHYTASVKNFRDGKWYYFNDSRVTEIKDSQECVTGAAYLLFYRKRSQNREFLGSEKLKRLIEDGRINYSLNLDSLKKELSGIKAQLDTFSEKPENKKDHHNADHVQNTNHTDSTSAFDESESKADTENGTEEAVEEDEEDDDDDDDDGAEEEVDEGQESEEGKDYRSDKEELLDSKSLKNGSKEKKIRNMNTRKLRESSIGESNEHGNSNGDNFKKRKQRLISKSEGLKKSIRLKQMNSMGNFSSDIASPVSSESEDNFVSDSISLTTSDTNTDIK